MTADEKRKLVRDKYSTIIGRNNYSQVKRDYCFKKYSDGKYYSDCSSSVSYSYRDALGKENAFGILNTVGMYNCKKFTEVPVKISKGQITNPEVLRIGDMLLYAGTDTSRASAGYVGHVEMYWGKDSNGVHWLYGHGSGNPKKTRMTEKNKSRYNAKTSTKVGNKGLIRVMRFIQDDTAGDTTDKKKVKIVNGDCYVRSEPNTSGTKLGTAKKGSTFDYAGEVSSAGWNKIRYNGSVGWVSGKYSTLEV